MCQSGPADIYVCVEDFLFRRYTALYIESELYASWNWEAFAGRIAVFRPVDADEEPMEFDFKDPFMWQLVPTQYDLDEDIGEAPPKAQALAFKECPAADLHTVFFSAFFGGIAQVEMERWGVVSGGGEGCGGGLEVGGMAWGWRWAGWGGR